jgi:release factor glutamine methyltransferase
MTIQEASKKLLFQLYHLYDDREAANIADWVMENITEWKRIDRIINKQVPLSAQQQDLLKTYTDQLMEHTPVQYVLGECWFYGMKLYVNKHVLIPRPETEELVQWIADDSKKEKINNPKLLDIGTGSGCIALALKKTILQADIHACDTSAAALQVAKKNAADLKLPVQFHRVDFLNKEERDTLPVVDCLVSNPPYIPLSNKANMQPNVLLHEPHLALFVSDTDPMIFYKAIADFARTHLLPNGRIYVEIHEALAQPVTTIFNQRGFRQLELKKDMQGKDRMIKAVKQA